MYAVGCPRKLSESSWISTPSICLTVLGIGFFHIRSLAVNRTSHQSDDMYATAYFWKMAHTKYGKRSLKHLGPMIWDNIDTYLHDCFPHKFEKQYRHILTSAYDDRYYGAGAWSSLCQLQPTSSYLKPTSFSNCTFPFDHIPFSHSNLYSILFLTLLYMLPFLTQLGCVCLPRF